jgi:predicted TIM-barrel fold metal-dependent hydrolase
MAAVKRKSAAKKTKGTTVSAKIRAKLDHPVVDSDGHWLETHPVFRQYIDAVAGPAMVERYQKVYGSVQASWYDMTPKQRQAVRIRRPGWWGLPVKNVDRAAAMIPRLFRDKLDDWGIDVALVYPTLGFGLVREIPDEELLEASVKAYNVMVADLFKDCSDRIIAAGVATLNRPDLAIRQIDQAHKLGLKMLSINGVVPRTLEADAAWQPDPKKRRVWIDGLGMDSQYDYDPVWQKFVDCGIAVTNHTGSNGWPDRNSPTSFVHCHLGHFAQAHHLMARSLFLGGVTQRFPTLNFGFLEGGVGWACNLLADLHGHWRVWNTKHMNSMRRPSNLDLKVVRRYFEQYAAKGSPFEGKIDQILDGGMDIVEQNMSQAELTRRDKDEDEFPHVDIRKPEDINRLFAEPFYFGCEAEDPMTAVAFDKKLGLNLKPILGSDISHFDVADADEVLEEAWELVEHGVINEDNFREFTFTNAVKLHGGMNPDFFKGTVVEKQAAKVLSKAATRRAPGKRAPARKVPAKRAAAKR